MNSILLTDQDIHAGKEAGKHRQSITSRKHKDSHGFKGSYEEGEAIHTDGALSEIAIAKLYNLPWIPFASDHRSIKADVGDRIQVRSTRRYDGNLILHEEDNPHQFFFLCRLSRLPYVDIVGWIPGHLGQQRRYWKSNWPRPCFLFPAHLLRSPESFAENYINPYASFRDPRSQTTLGR